MDKITNKLKDIEIETKDYMQVLEELIRSIVNNKNISGYSKEEMEEAMKDLVFNSKEEFDFTTVFSSNMLSYLDKGLNDKTMSLSDIASKSIEYVGRKFK